MPNEECEPIWVRAADIVSLNEQIVDQTGERHALRDEGLLDGAAARRSLYAYEGETDLIVLAVRLMVAIGKNHCFEQGNKRTAFKAAIFFLEMNGCVVEFSDDKATADLVRDVIISVQPESTMVHLMRQRMY